MLSRKSQFYVSAYKYCYIGIQAEMQVNTGSKRQDTNPAIRASYQLLHERMKDERQD